MFKELDRINPDSIILIETRNNKNEYLFELDEDAPKISSGNCSFCFKKSLLYIRCECMKVHYCEQVCSEKDAEFHQKFCNKNRKVEELAPAARKLTKKGIVSINNL
jgi:hypothetical protein